MIRSSKAPGKEFPEPDPTLVLEITRKCTFPRSHVGHLVTFLIYACPPRGDTILPQSNVGVILASGWSGELTYIDNVQIPLNEQRIERALNSIIFRPDENLSLERLPTQEVCAQIRYWEVRSPDLVQFFSWCFRVDG